MTSLFDEIYRVILLTDASGKCASTLHLTEQFADFSIDQDSSVKEIPTPGYPPSLRLVPPRQLKRRGIKHQEGRNVLMHAIAHIEFNAINLALDAAYRFRHQPTSFYTDWLRVAADEARHFSMIRAYLNQNGCEYGDLPAHNGLWDMAVETSHDVTARMALVPRVLEARGLDVTPGMINRLESVGDAQAVAILQEIYRDEIEHVKIGSAWFTFQCQQQDLTAATTFKSLVDKHLHGELKGPFNISARLLAGFEQEELDKLEQDIRQNHRSSKPG
ncbi:MAG: ferritin-like domain-containing protein [Pseudomonadota bacterium]